MPGGELKLTNRVAQLVLDGVVLLVLHFLDEAADDGLA
jgi:hypothetical protein